MSNIKKIILRGESRIQKPKEIYKDRLTMEEGSISYFYRPLFKSTRNPVREWTCAVDTAEYRSAFQAICDMIPGILEKAGRDADPGLAPREFDVTYEDGSKCVVKFWLPQSEFAEIFAAMQKLIPADEVMPDSLVEEDEAEFLENDGVREFPVF